VLLSIFGSSSENQYSNIVAIAVPEQQNTQTLLLLFLLHLLLSFATKPRTSSSAF